MNFKAWLGVTFIGLIIIIIQSFIPDLVPSSIEQAIEQNASRNPSVIDTEPFLKALLYVWLFSGFGLFAISVRGRFITQVRIDGDEKILI